MAGKKSVGRTYPKHLPKDGRGVVQCDASGMLRPAGTLVDDVRQGRAAKEFADLTPGFGSFHPQDLVALGNLDDPTAIPNARPEQVPLSKQDMGISDEEVRNSIKEDRPPRMGY